MEYVVFICHLFAFAVIITNTTIQAKSNENELIKERAKSNRMVNIEREIELVNSLEPIHSNQSAIMFWRPQKVGSSTILSILVSYGYRFNAITRRKSPVVNSLCIKMAKCALHVMNTSGSQVTSDISLDVKREKYLTQYIGRRSGESGSSLPPVRTGSLIPEMNAEAQSYKISTSHQVCSLQSSIVKESMKCIFSKNSKGKGKLNSSAPTGLYDIDVKELFVVRDPLSRAISIYYFWGELYRMHRNTKVRSRRKKDKRQLLSAASEGEAENVLTGEVNYISPGMIGEMSDLEFEKLSNIYDQNENNMENKSEHENTNGHPDNDKFMDISTDESHRVLAASASGKSKRIQLGQSGVAQEIVGSLFNYHGNESTAPNEKFALAFASSLPYKSGLPGPSYTWSVFANSAESAIQEIKGDRIMTIVTERLDESLLVASHYLGWSIADVVVTAPRKALSTHPKHTEWPAKAVLTMKRKLSEQNEYEVYDAANLKLNSRIKDLKFQGVNFTEELRTLNVLKERVTKLCLSEEYLVLYREKLKAEGYTQHLSNNKLRDGEDKYTEEGHCFSFNSDIMYSYDICGNCEAHGMLLAVQVGLAKTVDDAPTLVEIDKKYTKNNPNFAKCP